MKKTLSFLLALAMVLCLIPASAFAADSGFLSELAFSCVSTKAADKGCGVVLEPAFNADIHDYTLTVPDSKSYVYVWATLSDAGAGNTIKAAYTKTTGAAAKVSVTSANPAGASLANLIAAGKGTGNSLIIEVGAQTYNVSVIRSATLSSLTVTNADGKAQNLDPAFSDIVTEYTINTLDEAVYSFETKAKLTDSVISGADTLELTAASWNSGSVIDRVITVSGAAITTDYTLHFKKIDTGLDGKGTENDPFILKTADDMSSLSAMVASGISFSGIYFRMDADITLPEVWTPLGTMKDGKTEPAETANNPLTNINPFSGNIDGGGHTLTVPAGGLPLIGFAYEASVKDLNIYGEKIDGYGLVNNYHITGPDTTCISIDSVTLKFGTKTLKSGLLGGYSSGTFKVYINNCTAEEGVVIGYAKDQKWIGSFAGEFNGEITGCVSHADVYGTDFVGGIAADQGQSMSEIIVRDCIFDGSVTGSGQYVGGILAHGYGGTGWGFANNPCFPSVVNCICTADVSGAEYVGGILGAEAGSSQTWENGTGYIQSNFFGGTISSDGTNVGAVIGGLKSLDNYTVISDNFYLENCGAAKGIGAVVAVDSAEKYGRSDVTAETASEFLTASVGSVNEDLVEKLNSGRNSGGNWILEGSSIGIDDTKHVVAIGTEPSLRVRNGLTVNDGTEINNYKLLVKYSDGSIELKDISEATLENYDLTTVHNTAASLVYGTHQFTFMLNVKTPVIDPVMIKITVNNKGVLASASDGSLMAEREVVVNDVDKDGIITVNDALVSAHETYMTKDGYAAEVTEYGTSVTKLWGIDTWNALFFVDGSPLSIGVGVDTIGEGQTLYASINADDTYYADWYCAFDKNAVSAETGESIELTLCGGQGMASYPADFSKPVDGVMIGTWESGKFVQLGDTVTDTDGKASISFDAAGTYYVTAKGSVADSVITDWSTGASEEKPCPIMAPYCVVTVTNAAPAPSDPEDENIDVSFRLIGCEQAAKDVDLSVDTYLPEYVTWISTRKYTMEKDDTVADLLRKALKDAGLECTGIEAGYVSAIEAPEAVGGYVLAQMDNGACSGWMFTVNGEYPVYSLGECRLADGDAVVWHYVCDYMNEISAWGGSAAPELQDQWLKAEDKDPVKETEPSNENPSESVTEPALESPVTAPQFVDVQADAYYASAVAWAVENAVTIGIGDSKFGTGNDCTREQMVTFLWNLAGKPDASGESFSDVKTGTYYEKAAVWARELGITAGKADGSFGVGDTVTREQVVTFLWNYAGKPEPKMLASFSDVAADDYYAKAVAWAKEKNITAGIGGGKFGSGKPCTREQIVTLMYNCFAAEKTK